MISFLIKKINSALHTETHTHAFGQEGGLEERWHGSGPPSLGVSHGYLGPLAETGPDLHGTGFQPPKEPQIMQPWAAHFLLIFRHIVAPKTYNCL